MRSCVSRQRGGGHENQRDLDRLPAGISGGVCVNHLWPVVAGGGVMSKMTKQVKAMQAALTALKSIDAAMPFPVAKFAIHHLEGALAEALAEQPAPSQYGSPELQALIVARAMEKNAAEQPAQQEPMAWIERDMSCDDFDPDSVTCQKPYIAAEGWEWVPLYTTPQPPAQRQWVGLTDDEIDKTPCELYAPDQGGMTLEEGLQLYARAIETKLKEKNT